MHPKLQAIVNGAEIRTVGEWVTAVQLFLTSVKVPSPTLFSRFSDERAIKFIDEVLALSVLDVRLSHAGTELGMRLGSMPIWVEATSKLLTLQRHANDACANLDRPDFLTQLESHLVKLGLADAEPEVIQE